MSGYLLTTKEAAEQLNVPERWVADAARAGRIRCTRIGKHLRFRPEHVEELINAGEQPVTAPSPTLAMVPSRRVSSSRSKL